MICSYHLSVHSLLTELADVAMYDRCRSCMAYFIAHFFWSTSL